MKLTVKQKNCPYCHLDFDVWTDEYSSGFSYIDSDFPGHWYVETKICAKNFILKTRTTIKKIGLAEGKYEPIDVDIEYLERA